jgi:uncharacterized protein (DUF1684 family)
MRISGWFFCILFSCTLSAQTNYRQSIADWDKQRLAELKSSTGWLNVAGLFWLKPGKNTFGRNPANNIIFNKADFPAELGRFEWSGDTIYWITNKGQSVKLGDKPVQSAIALILNQNRVYTFSFKHYQWNLIQRENRVAIRFRDLENPSLSRLDSIPRYPVDSAWRITARLVPMPNKQLSITNVLGQTIKQPSAGRLDFRLNGVPYSLQAIDEGNDQLFILFGDDTNALETYASGRYLYVEKPGSGDVVILDFNKAENPPCAFTPYGTCPLPPFENRLPIPIKAGEKEVHVFDLK